MDLGFHKNHATWFVTPVKSYADLTALKDLRAANVQWTVAFQRRATDGQAHVTLTNAGPTVAFFVRLEVTKGPQGDEVLPVLWQDNYISLLPGERRDVTATYQLSDLGGARPAVKVSGWNVR